MRSPAVISADKAWGHLPPCETMLQIGSNSFHTDGDLDKLFNAKLRIADTLQEKLKVIGSETILEIGTGLGIQTKYFSEICKFIYTVDVSNGFSEYFGKYCGHCTNVKRIIKQFFPMMDEIPSGSVDCAFSMAVFCHLHVYDIMLYLVEIGKKLKVGGRFFVNFQNCDNYYLETPFLESVASYSAGTYFQPIHVAQLQYHSRDFFRAAGMRVGLAVVYESTKASYTELMYGKVG
jgi:cyclopropane fatty-acyl-phospholipid synthase-like methyltransferase